MTFYIKYARICRVKSTNSTYVGKVLQNSTKNSGGQKMQQAVDQSRSSRVLAGKDVVLVKFAFTNPKHIPQGIDRITRLSNQFMDAMNRGRAEESGNKRLGREGRFREGRVDTGYPIVNNLPFVQAALIRCGLANNDYKLVDAHWFRKEGQRGHQPKFMVCLSFKKGASENIELSRKTLDAVRQLANTVWNFCHVWQNTNNFTVNFVGRMPDGKPHYALRVSEGEFVTDEVKELIHEALE